MVSVNKGCRAFRNGDVILKQDGTIDLRSPAFKSGDLITKPTSENTERRNFTHSERAEMWEKAKTIPGCNPNVYRQDKVGNVIYKKSYGKNSEMGFDIDHSKPLSKGIPLQHNNILISFSDAFH